LAIVLILGMDMRAFQSGDPRWMTYRQAHGNHWQVRKGEKSTTIFFAKPYEVDDEENEDGRKTVRILKHYAVFHASQIDGIPDYKAPSFEEAPWTRPEAADIILKNSGAVVRIGGDRAFYSPATDHIQLPPEHAFRGPPEFAATALHELGHNAASGIMPRRTRYPEHSPELEAWLFGIKGARGCSVPLVLRPTGQSFRVGEIRLNCRSVQSGLRVGRLRDSFAEYLGPNRQVCDEGELLPDLSRVGVYPAMCAQGFSSAIAVTDDGGTGVLHTGGTRPCLPAD
jgi:hypothetical protein